MKKLILIILVIAVIVILIIGINFYKKVSTPYKGYEKEVRIQIKKGSSVRSISEQLYQNKVISNKKYFIIYYKLYYKDLTFKSGEYLFDKPLTMKTVIEKLHKGKIILHKITIKEGLTIDETAEFLKKNHNINYEAFLHATKNIDLIFKLDRKATDLEGYLYPDTYLVPNSITAKELVKLMVNKFKKKITPSMQWRARDVNLSIRDIIILASLIEKETSSRDERFLISSVFHNRLKIGMPMGCDPTIVYALKRENKYNGKLGWKDLKFASPYNTRIHKGLPPGPICNPGYDSIEASLYPENTKYLYFVAKDLKYHHFSRTLKEHNWAVKKYIINKKK